MALTKLQEVEGFGSRNIALISGVFVILMVFAISQRPAISGDKTANAPLAPNTDQLASLNPAPNQQGAVLGASTLDPQTEQILSKINIQTSTDNSAAAISNYKNQVAVVLQNDRIDAISTAQATAAVEQQQNKALNDLQAIAAPSTYGDVHRMLLAYYSLVFAKDSGQASGSGISDQDLSTAIQNLHDLLNSAQVLPN